MINHVRTVILNRHHSEVDGESLSELVDPSFVPTSLSAWQSGLRRALLGQVSGLSSELAAMRVLMPMLHTSDLDRRVREFDPRITYVFPLASDVVRAEAIIRDVELYMREQTSAVRVFRQSGTDPQFLSDMRALYAGNAPGIVQVGAVALAYCYGLNRGAMP